MHNDSRFDYEYQLVDEKNRNPLVWDSKKKKTRELASSYKRLGNVKKATLVSNCGTFLEFRRYMEDNEFKLHKANFCKVRLCPMCAWRRSLKIFGQTSAIMEQVPKGHKFIFLTLTIRNPTGEELQNTLDDMFKAYNLFAKRKDMKECFVGWFRALEVTYNKQANTYHPHFHVILCCTKRYFKEYYMKHEKFVAMWRECLNLKYDPWVHVEKFTTRQGIAEASKYTVKDTDYYTKKGIAIDRVVDTLDKALFSRRLIAYGGILKDIKKQLKLDDSIDGDLVNTTGNELREDLDFVVERYGWHVGFQSYFLLKDKGVD